MQSESQPSASAVTNQQSTSCPSSPYPEQEAFSRLVGRLMAERWQRLVDRTASGPRQSGEEQSRPPVSYAGEIAPDRSG